MNIEKNNKKIVYKALFIFILYIYLKHGPAICFTLLEKNNILAYLFYPTGLLYTSIVKIVDNTSDPVVYLNLIYDSIFIIILVSNYIGILKEKFKDFKTNIFEFFKKYIKYWLMAIFLMAISNIMVENITNAAATNEENVRQLIEANPFILLIITGLMAPVIEELVYRLTVYNIVGKNKKLFIILSGLLFGGAHVIASATCINDLLYIIPYSIPGFALAYIYNKSNNIYVPMLFHCIHNTFAFILQILL